MRQILYIAICIYMYTHTSNAETILTTTEPAAKILLSDAQKTKPGTPLVKCERVKTGPNLNPVKVPNSKASWHTALPKASEDAVTQLSTGKQVYRCSEVEIDATNGRVHKTN